MIAFNRVGNGLERSRTGGNGNLYYYLDPCDGRPDISLNDDINYCKTRRMKVGTKFRTISSSTSSSFLKPHPGS